MLRKIMKNLLLILITAIVLWGCSSSIDTSDYTADEKLAYAMQLYQKEDWDDAATEFQAIVLQYPGNAVVDDAQFYLGQTRFKRGEYIIAAYEFSKLIRNMPASEFVPESQLMLAECYYQLSPNYTLDQKYTKKAIEEYQAFIDFFPTHKKVHEAERKISELNEKLALKEYETAKQYERLEYYTAALIYYNNLLDFYHDTKYAPLAMYNKIKVLTLRNRNTEAIAEISKFLQRYPENSNSKEMQELKSSLENKLSAAQ
jgi:outer membrane protein assembly factor BamD